MFFALSKIIGVLLNPLVWTILLLLCSLLVKKYKLKKRLVQVTIFVLLIFSNGFIINEAMLLWEKQPVAEQDLKVEYDFGVVLSGMVWSDSAAGKVNFLQSSDRIWQAVSLYKKGKIHKILISGGDAGFFARYEEEALILKDFLIGIGIPASDILTELKSRNTWENALYCKEYLSGIGALNSDLLLITSATHMRRAQKCFEKLQLHPDIYPVDSYSGTRKYDLEHLIIPNILNLQKWDILLHEIFGMISYKIAGYV